MVLVEDARFTFANERTFFAWIRTPLGLVVAGVAVKAFSDGAGGASAATTLVVLGRAVSAQAFFRRGPQRASAAAAQTAAGDTVDTGVDRWRVRDRHHRRGRGAGMSQTEKQLWETAAQPERTALAWSRTAFAGITVLAILVRELVVHNPTLAIAFAGPGLPVVAAVVLAASSRYRASHRRVCAGQPLAGAALPATCAALTVVTGLVALGYILLA